LESTQRQLSETVDTLSREVAERKKVESELQQSEQRWRELSNATFDSVITIVDDKIVNANRPSELIFAIDHNTIIGQTAESVFGGEYWQIIKQSIVDNRTLLSDFQFLKEGKEKFLDIHIHPVAIDDDTGYMLAIRDVTEKTLAMQRLERLANYDSLTGLPNRARFQRIVNRELMSSNFNQQHALLFLDLDNFKEINDTYGHSAGDLLLYNLASRLTNDIRGNNTLCRLGGDEFAIWIPNIHHDSDAIKVAQQVLKSLEQPFAMNREEIHASFSIGIAIYPHDGTDYSSLSQNSDQAMYQAKGQGRNRYQLFCETKVKST
ncbi:MAG: sensor domain-containing diguanylate cyclase, partial [Kangiellaceae bacterium]|nr:sensor domain-containing diguanylate cyclase [Kangiellaceae bacterium]